MTCKGTGSDMLCKNVNQFCELIPQLELRDLLLTEYCENGKWCNLVEVCSNARNTKYTCSLCAISQTCPKNVKAHISGKRHKLLMQSNNQFYHPKYFVSVKYPTVSDSTKDTLTECTRTSVDIAIKTSPTVASAKIVNTKKIPTNQTEKIIPTVQRNDVQIITHKDPTTSKDCIDLTSSQPDCVDTPKSKAWKEESAESENVTENPDTFKSIESDDVSGNVDGAKNNKMDITCIEASHVLDRKTEDSNIKKSASEEVIVIDDDKPAELDENESLPESDDFNNSFEEQPLEKKPKILINPAAFVKRRDLNKAHNSIDNIKYKSNIIITPTVHKNKTKQANLSIDKLKYTPTPSTNKTNSTVLTGKTSHPNFLNKTFSSQPNDNDIHGLIGVEYVIKTIKSRQDIAPRYECSLCELSLDGIAMQNHLMGYNHRLKFCEKHFPTAIRQCKQYMNGIDEHEVFKVMTPLLAKLAIAIEKHHGRDLPYECVEREYQIHRNKILTKVYSCRHASEESGPTFTHVVNASEVDNFIAMRHNYKPIACIRESVFDFRPGRFNHRVENSARRAHPYKYAIRNLPAANYYQPFPSYSQHSERDSVLDDETHKALVENFLKDTNKCSQQSLFEDLYPERTRNIFRRSRSHSKSPINRGLSRSISPLRENDIWQAYRHLVDQKLKDLNDSFELYRNEPELYPSYKEEWAIFWKRRKDELVESGIDHRTFNYQIEWIRFFKVRLEELYGQAIENIKIDSRRRLCLPMTNIELSDPKYHVSCINSEDVEPTKIRKHIPVVKQYEVLDSRKIPRVVAVLRLMTAFEEHLGSLGPKIIDLLSLALQTDKTNPAELNTVILTRDNCTLLETAVEKLKGLVLTGLLQSSKSRSINKVVLEVMELLKFSDTELKKKSFNANEHFSKRNITKSVNMQALLSQNRQHHQQEPLQQFHQATNSAVSFSNFRDETQRNDVVTKITSTFAAQGKLDIDPQYLQKLVSIYTAIEKKKRDTTWLSALETTASTSNTLDNQQTLSDTLRQLLNHTTSNSFSSNTALPTPSYMNPSNNSYNMKRDSNRCVRNYRSDQAQTQQHVPNNSGINLDLNSMNPTYEDNVRRAHHNNPINSNSNAYTNNPQLNNNSNALYQIRGAADVNRSINTNTFSNSNFRSSWTPQTNPGQNMNRHGGALFNINNNYRNC